MPARRSSITVALGAFCLLVGPAGCLAPRHQHRSIHGLVRADSPAEAEELAILLEHLYPRVVEILPGAEQPFVDVWLQPRVQPSLFDLRGANTYGCTVQGTWPVRIHVGSTAPSRRWVLAHELTHAVRGSAWDPMPRVIEEGLCDVVAVRVCPDVAAGIRAERLLEATVFCAGIPVPLELELPIRDESGGWRTGPTTERTLLTIGMSGHGAVGLEEALAADGWHSKSVRGGYGIGYLMVERIARQRGGLEGLLRLCEHATRTGHDVIPSAWLLEAAALPDAAAVRAAVVEQLGASELRAILRGAPDLAVRVLWEVLERHLVRGLPPGDALDLCRPRLVLPRGGTLPLAELPEVRTRFQLLVEAQGVADARELR